MVEVDQGYAGDKHVCLKYEKGVSIIQFIAKNCALACGEKINGSFKIFA